jgi:hypothetical protein
VGDETVDTATGDLSAVQEDEGGEEDEKADDDEPEDDFHAAWDVLDLARAYYDKQEGDDMKLKLAEAYMSLGDVSMETGGLFVCSKWQLCSDLVGLFRKVRTGNCRLYIWSGHQDTTFAVLFSTSVRGALSVGVGD